MSTYPVHCWDRHRIIELFVRSLEYGHAFTSLVFAQMGTTEIGHGFCYSGKFIYEPTFIDRYNSEFRLPHLPYDIYVYTPTPADYGLLLCASSLAYTRTILSST